MPIQPRSRVVGFVGRSSRPLMGSAPPIDFNRARARPARAFIPSRYVLASFPEGSTLCTRAANIPRSAPRSPPIPERACRVHCEKANAAISAYIAKKIRQRVKDLKVADKLIPKDHGFGTRRVPLESGYFETYNRDNVTLIDTLVDEPIECITPQGIKTARQEHEFDILVYATGFDGVTGAFDRIDIRGENGPR